MNRRMDDERLADWVDGRLSPEALERFEAELAADPELRAAAEDYRRTVESVRNALRTSQRPRAGLADRVLARAAAETATPDVDTPRMRFLPWIGSLAAAAALVIAFFGIRQLAQETAPDAERTAYSEDAGRPVTAPEVREFETDTAADAFTVEREEAGRRGVSDLVPERAADDDEARRDRAAGLTAPSTVTGPAAGAGRSPGPAGPTAGGELRDTQDQKAADEIARRARVVEEPEPAADPAAVGLLERQRELGEELGRVTAEDKETKKEEFSLGAGARETQPGAPADQSAPSLGTLVYVVEFPQAVAAEQTATADPGVRRLRQGLPEGALPAENGVADWQGYAYRFVQAPLQVGAYWSSNVVPPDVSLLDNEVLQLALTPAGEHSGVAGEGKVADGRAAAEQAAEEQAAEERAAEGQVAQTRSETEPDAAEPAAKVALDSLTLPSLAELSGAYQALDGDAAFQLSGDPQQVHAFLRRILTAAAAQGGRLVVQRTPLVPGPWAQSREQLAGAVQKRAEAREPPDQPEPAPPREAQVLLVLRQQQAPAATGKPARTSAEKDGEKDK